MLSLQEDIDLLALSFLPQQQAQGLALKAVYRDTVVGIRYLHSRDTAATPVCEDLNNIIPVCIVSQVHRRFQITFMSSSAVLEFIDTIRTICPCKANPLPGPAPVLARNTTAVANIRSTAGSVTADQTRNQGIRPSGPPPLPAPPAFLTGSIQGSTHGLHVPFPSSQGVALASSESNVYSSSPLGALTSYVLDTSTESVVSTADNDISERLLRLNHAR